MKKNTKTKLLLILACTLFFALYLFASFTLITKKEIAFKASIIFSSISFIILTIEIVIDIKKDTIILEYPKFKLTFLYFIVQIIAGTLINVFSFIIIPLVYGIQIVILVIYLIVFLCLSALKSQMQSFDKETRDSKNSFNKLIAKLNTIKNDINNQEVLNKFDHFIENVKYSDPISVKEALKIEKQLNINIDDLSLEIAYQEKDIVLKKIADLEFILAQRNEIVKNNK